ncbi:hypothetical protein CDAR_582291 [Caerostris darwini]|uniref:Uncharacterized protein n=1 Tax=Caerostris darwini TaxID=1538125 RepID=A0AAV4RKB6_9ARAC|nr:hypothetical protein CDAR_582291 [Caerostris darwini]
MQGDPLRANRQPIGREVCRNNCRHTGAKSDLEPLVRGSGDWELLQLDTLGSTGKWFEMRNGWPTVKMLGTQCPIYSFSNNKFKRACSEPKV